MKNSVNLFFVLLCLHFVPSFAQGDKLISKQKKIYRHFSIKSTDTLALSNTCGKIIIHTWKKQEVTINIVCIGSAKTEAKATLILNNIKITENKPTADKYTFTTEVKTTYNKDNGLYRINDSEHEANIIYEINIPDDIVLDIKASLGKVYLDDFKGKLNVDIMHGSLNFKNLYGPDKKIVVDQWDAWGDSHITSIESGNIIALHNTLTIDKPIDKSKVKFSGTAGLIFGKGK